MKKFTKRQRQERARGRRWIKKHPKFYSRAFEATSEIISECVFKSFDDIREFARGLKR